ncbi:MAG: hypothetical protein GWN01_07800 [Nitrosopumilaceae archaeon]|nr:LEA type 2 family protein [Nitrosopumilaceae archaeon]NIU00824.1 LEA type 2 family protein [Nitrosopumilaceae archaeon]NIU87277.1 hypothetical protein [Nitrosopumilaceae archaeon]NIV65805.1 hypothetical protein [Nitrosopumilaceae archaeon]NIX61426.1 hypothetical protein [Nitrosopumilaceae archaeon]
MLVYVAIAGLLALMGGFVYYASLDNPKLEQVEIQLKSVKVLNVNTVEERAQLEVTFLVRNPSDKTFTIPSISYDLSVEGERLGSGQYSTEDIAMPGRAAFYPDAEIPLKNSFSLVKAQVEPDIYNRIVNEQITSFSAEGVITVESAWSIVEKEFKTSM